MSEAEPKAELDASTAATGSGPPDDFSGKTDSVENDKQLSAVGKVADVGQECKEQRKYDDEKMTEAGNANVDNGEDPKVAEADDLNNKEAEDTRKERDKDGRKEESMGKEKKSTEDVKKEKCEDTNKEEAKNTKEKANGNSEDMKENEGKDEKMEEVDHSKAETKDTTKEEVNDIKKEDGEDVKKEEAVGTKEEAKFTVEEEAKDMKNEELKNTSKGEICSVKDVDMQDKEVGDETMEEENDVAEEKDNREVKKNSEWHKAAEGEAEAKDTKRGELDNVKDVDMEDQEVGDKKVEEVKDVREEKDNKEIKEKVVESKEAEGETGAKDVKMEEVESADDVDMEDKEVRDKKIEDKDATEVKDNVEVKKKDEENTEAEREAEAGDMEGEKIESVIYVNMEDKVGDKKMENYKDVTEEKDIGEIEKKVEESREAEGEGEGLKKKGIRGQKISEKGETKEKKGEKKAKEISTPIRFIERPVRERKSVERLVEALDSESVKPFIIEKGRGTPLKDIPNVAYKVSKKKPAQLKLMHQTLFGRIGKAINYKNHILQFSGFVWHESEDKQKTKVKEKLDKCIKDTLLDFCDLFDLPLLKAKSNARKEELVAMLLDFMVAPHATTDVILSEQEKQSSNSKKRKRGAKGSGSKSSGSLSGKRSHKGNMESEVSPNTEGKSAHEMEDEGKEDEKNGVPSEDGAPEHSESKEEEIGSEAAEEDETDDDESVNKLQQIKSPKKGGSADTKKLKVSATSKKMSSPTTAKSPTKSSSSKQSKVEDKTNGGTKDLSKKEKEIEQARKKTAHSKTDFQEKSSGRKVSKGKAKTKESGESGPSKEELRKTICEILNRVDFNTATFTDILKELASHYGMDLTPKKPLIKLMIQEELTKLAEEDEEDSDEDN